MMLRELVKAVLSRKTPPVLGLEGTVVRWVAPVRMHTANCYEPVISGEERVLCTCGLSLAKIASTSLFLSEAFSYGNRSFGWFVLDDSQVKLVSVDENFDILDCVIRL